MKFLQKIGKSLMLPIASLPVAALLLRLGVFIGDFQHAPYVISFIGQIILSAGDTLFGNLGLIFAVGIAIGFSKDQHGSAALAGLIGYLVVFSVMGAAFKAMHPKALSSQSLDNITSLSKYKLAVAAQIDKYNIPVFNMHGFGGSTILPGIVIGIVAGGTYNKFSNTKLPQALSFFGGKRLVPLLTSLFAIVIGITFAIIWPYLSQGMDWLGKGINSTKPFGFFAYGLLNRLLIPTGLHHVLNTFFWFTTGHCASDASVQGDISMFLKNCKVASGFSHPGSFQAGFFPIMMFGLPAAGIAIAQSAKKEKRKEIFGLMLGVAAVSFVTGVTEPIEFAFMFVSPVLFVFHAIFTGLSHLITNWFGIYHGFGFSAGLFDYVLNYSIATKPILLLPIGLGFGALYYTVFKIFISKFNILTPGREEESVETIDESKSDDIYASRAQVIYDGLGGEKNIVEINNCTTRLRLVLKDTSIIDENKIKSAKAMGQLKLSSTEYQVIIGPDVEFIADEMKKI